MEALARLRDLEDDKTVLFSVTVHMISQVDPLMQTFAAEITVHQYWFEKQLVDYQLDKDTTYLDADKLVGKLLVPALHFDNSIRIEPVSGTDMLEMRRSFPSGVVHWEQRVIGTFSEMFELEYFPFDVQTLSIAMRINSKADIARGRVACDLHTFVADVIAPVPASTSDSDEPQSTEHVKDKYAVHIRGTVRMAEWRLYHPTSEVSSDSQTKGRCNYSVHLVVRRRHEYWTQSVMTIMGMMCSLALTTHVVPTHEFSGRASIVLTLMLTAVAFKFLISGELPKVPYSTFLDSYIDWCFIFLMLVVLENWMLAAGWWQVSFMNEQGELSEQSGRALMAQAGSFGKVDTAQTRTQAIESDVQDARASDLEAALRTLEHRIEIVLGTGWVLFNAFMARCARAYVVETRRLLGEEINAYLNGVKHDDQHITAQRVNLYSIGWQWPFCRSSAAESRVQPLRRDVLPSPKPMPPPGSSYRRLDEGP